jgi:predicted  nucleic acid-binding Zn-ribbon protein
MEIATALRSLAVVDVATASLRHQLVAMPEVQELTQVEEHLRTLTQEFKQLTADRAPLTAQRDELDSLRESLSQRKATLQATLDSSTSGARDLATLVSEIEILAQKLDDVETKELEIMELLEPFDEQEQEIKAAGQPLMTRRGELTAAIAAGRLAIDEHIAAKLTERMPLLDALPESLRATYERVHARVGDAAAVDVEGGRCGGCRIAMVPLDLERWRSAPADTFPVCPECSRLLLPAC